ncbi:HAD family acid phosphatase [Sneathiella sp.]|uniref:5'-nucleotidase, lipoprotein e(P4) family n=1 Tax=Sneathiella sp. TaxID=1964365 RepID=UPI0025FE3588|nr:HAD family acid phosphatase [Sneathiella sp.]|tara:strand:- start:61 stop:912 length:852 start_codon:yes stop_codon:yes gene_type:complete
MKIKFAARSVLAGFTLATLMALPITAQAEENDLTNATLWTQTSVEFKATALAAYKLAEVMLDRGLADKNWTAAIEQEGDYQNKPAAVILDVDETVLDNTAYEAWLIKAKTGYSSKTWAPFVMGATSKPIAGSKEFIDYARSKGVEIFYVSNRKAPEEEGTVKNLKDLGYYVNEEFDTVLLRGEKEEWGSDKTTRRAHVAKDYRVVMIVGDNLGDFVEARDATLAERDALIDTYKDYWSSKWITIANPMYGSWEAATFGYDFKLPNEEKRQMKLDSMTYWDPKE